MKYINIPFFFLLIAFTSILVFAQNTTERGKVYTCDQPKKEKLTIIDKADSEPFRVARIEFVGNTYVRDRDLRKGLTFSEGDIFTKKNLKKTINNLSRLNYIYPISPKNVDVALTKTDKYIYMIFCVEDRPKNK